MFFNIFVATSTDPFDSCAAVDARETDLAASIDVAAERSAR
jgi:hypothetical protein